MVHKKGWEIVSEVGEMGNRKTVKGKIAIALISMVVLIFGNGLTVAGNWEEVSIIKKEYSNQRRHNEIQIFYPQIQGLDDEGKEKRINYQIRKDATRLVSGIVYEKDNLWHNLDYEIKFLNGKMISVCYKGRSGATIAVERGWPNNTDHNRGH